MALDSIRSSILCETESQEGKGIPQVPRREGYIELVDEDGRRMWVLSTSGGSIVEKVRAIYGLFESDFPTRRAYT